MSTRVKAFKPKLACPKLPIMGAIRDANNIMGSLVEDLNQLSYIQPFGANINGSSARSAHESLVKHRITSKFCVVDQKKADSLRETAYQSYLDYEVELSRVHERFNLWDNTRIGYVLRHARSTLHGWFKDFSVDFDDNDLPLEFPSGETVIPAYGQTSLLAKLADLSQWTTTYSALDDTCRLIYSIASLKRAARYHIGHISRKLRRNLYTHFSKFPGDTGYLVFCHLLKYRVLTIVDGARASSVHKNNETDRFINVEPLFPMILQRICARKIKEVLTHHGNNLFPFREEVGRLEVSRDSQWEHGQLIKDKTLATIDFKNASDSVLWRVVLALFPKQLTGYLMKFRSHFVTFKDFLVEPFKLSSMGNGFTFEVMTALLFAIGQQLSFRTRVFGDDVIIPNQSADEFAEVCAYVGFNINVKKSFVKSNFRESCGYFYHDDAGYLLSFEFTECSTFQDVIVTHNKLVLLTHEVTLGRELKQLLTDYASKLYALGHASRSGPIPDRKQLQQEMLGMYFYTGFHVRSHKNKAVCREAYNFTINKWDEYFKVTQQSVKDFVVIWVPAFLPSEYKGHARAECIIYNAALLNGKRVKDTITGKGRWLDLPALVHSDGSLTLIRDLRNTVNSVRAQLPGDLSPSWTRRVELPVTGG